jgi:hypothetical protein
MKLSHFLLAALMGTSILATSCQGKKDDTSAEQPVMTTDPGTVNPDPASVNPATVSATTASTTSEPHYKCPKGCAGGGGPSQGKCAVCGTDLVHNQAFHNQAPGAQAPGTSPQAPIVIDPTNATAPTTNQAVPKNMEAAAAQNPKGEWHYKCSKGCEGGAAAAGNCAKCGNPLTHNQAFHQQ